MLAEQETTLKAKNEAADKLIKIVSDENVIVQKEKLIGSDSVVIDCINWNWCICCCCCYAAAEEERRVRAIEEDVTIKAKICEADLRKAEPSLIAANEGEL